MDKDLKDLPKLQDSNEKECKKTKISSSSSLSNEHDAADHYHECIICDKTFQTAQALSYHRRCHLFLASKKKSLTHFSKKGTNRDNFNDNDYEKTICYSCNKKFSSKNASYGHMKGHPNRVSKASNPLNHYHPNSSSSLNSNSSIDQDDSFDEKNNKKNCDLLEWEKKNRRRQRWGEIYTACTTLISMANVTNFYPEFLLPFKKRKFRICESSKENEKQPMDKIRIVDNGLMMFEKKHDVAYGSGGSGSSGLSESRVDENKVLKKKSKEKTEEKTSTYDPDLEGYKCSICGKYFSSFQSDVDVNVDVDVIVVAVAVADVDGGNTNVVVASDAQENDSRNTSEDMPKVEEQEKVVNEEPVAESSGHKKYEFDLNEPYFMED